MVHWCVYYDTNRRDADENGGDHVHHHGRGRDRGTHVGGGGTPRDAFHGNRTREQPIMLTHCATLDLVGARSSLTLHFPRPVKAR